MSEPLAIYRLLPPAQFVAQPVRFVREPLEVWRGPNCPDRPPAIGMPVVAGEDGHFGAPAGLAYVERYGGLGIGRNGGGSRCGLYGGLAVKGFGASALAGRGQDYWHAFGGMSLREAVREAVWGAVLNQLLPHGAVETEAVMLTGSEVPLRYADSQGRMHAPRALSFRRPFVRLAHFLPATLFLPDTAHEGRLLSDDARTRASILALPEILARLFGESVDGADVLVLLKRLFVRYGRQTGTARALRLVHGSVTASNIGLDGRMLDFGSTIGISDFGRIRTVYGFPDAWEQSRDLHRALPVLLAYVGRHLNAAGRIDVGACSAELAAALRAAEAQAYEAGLVDQVGIPRERLAALAPASRAGLGAVLQEISEAGCEPFKLRSPCDDYVPHMPDRMGRYHLGHVLAGYWHGVACGDWRAFTEELGRRPLRERLLSALENVRCAVLACDPTLDAASMAHWALAECRRRHDPLSHLHHLHLNADIDRLPPEPHDVTRFIERAVGRATQVLAPPAWPRDEPASPRVQVPAAAALQPTL